MQTLWRVTKLSRSIFYIFRAYITDVSVFVRNVSLFKNCKLGCLSCFGNSSLFPDYRRGTGFLRNSKAVIQKGNETNQAVFEYKIVFH